MHVYSKVGRTNVLLALAGLKRNRVYVLIPSQESKSLVRFMSNVVNVFVPSQVCGEGDTKIFH